MKNSSIHTGLDKKEIRDYLSSELVRLFEQETTVVRKVNKYVPGFEYTVRNLENEVEFHKQKLDIAYKKQAVLQLIKMNGWQEFDVSDDAANDLRLSLHMNFLGTQQEYDALMKVIEKET